MNQRYWKEQEEELKKILELKREVYCIGDCLTLGVGTNEKLSYPTQLQNILDERYEVINLGRTMLKMENLLEFSSLFEDKIKSNNGIVCVWAGTNDLYGEQPVQNVANWYIEFCSNLKENGLKIISMTILPRSNITPPHFEEYRLMFNEFVRENYLEFSDKIVDFGSSDLIGKYGQEFDSLWYDQSNNAHLNDLGYHYVARLVANAVYDIK